MNVESPPVSLWCFHLELDRQVGISVWFPPKLPGPLAAQSQGTLWSRPTYPTPLFSQLKSYFHMYTRVSSNKLKCSEKEAKFKQSLLPILGIGKGSSMLTLCFRDGCPLSVEAWRLCLQYRSNWRITEQLFAYYRTCQHVVNLLPAGLASAKGDRWLTRELPLIVMREASSQNWLTSVRLRPVLQASDHVHVLELCIFGDVAQTIM